MNRDEVTKLAQDCGWVIHEDMPYMDVQAVQDALIERLERFAALVESATLEGLTEKTTGNLVHIKLNIMKTALENIAGIRPIVDNLLSDKDIALIALERINSYEQRKN